MNIPNLGKNGSVDPVGDRTAKAGARRDVLVPFVPRDEARISASGREAAAVAEQLTERARGDDGDREQLVARAIERLRAGELDRESVYAATAQRLLDAKFVSG